MSSRFVFRSVALVTLIGASPTLLTAEYGDIKFTRPGSNPAVEVPTALFPHWVHRMQYKCYACHEDIFQMKAGSNVIDMDAIQSGKFCGTCHNGKIAFQVTFDSCPRCHKS